MFSFPYTIIIIIIPLPNPQSPENYLPSPQDVSKRVKANKQYNIRSIKVCIYWIIQNSESVGKRIKALNLKTLIDTKPVVCSKQVSHPIQRKQEKYSAQQLKTYLISPNLQLVSAQSKKRDFQTFQHFTYRTQIICYFSKVGGHKTTTRKSAAFLKTNNQSKMETIQITPFIITSKRIKYLGINKVKDLYTENYKILLNKIKNKNK